MKEAVKVPLCRQMGYTLIDGGLLKHLLCAMVFVFDRLVQQQKGITWQRITWQNY